MRKFLVLAVICVAAWYGCGKLKPSMAQFQQPSVSTAQRQAEPETAAGFKCDGRTHCSEMRSCAEANYFIQHCPNTKMKGMEMGCLVRGIGAMVKLEFSYVPRFSGQQGSFQEQTPIDN